MKSGDVDWIFDALPPSGARRGGDPAKHAFEANLQVFVREVVQNAIDQSIAGETPEIHFRFHDLGGAALESFFQALRWKTLKEHLVAVSSLSRGGKLIARGLADLEKRKKLLVLVIEDRGTVGLTGAEDAGDSHFRALCKDTLFSHKQSEGAGGSYGLGKSVLWGFSGLSTVVFNSRLSHEEEGQSSPRLIGRAELPSHELKELQGRKSQQRSFAGPGWFGVRDASAHRATSLWGQDAAALAEALRLKRNEEEITGTSILVLGFRDPAADVDQGPDELAKGIRAAIEREFWPAVAMQRLTSWVAGDGAAPFVSSKTFKSAGPLVECYRRRDSAVEALIDGGDVVAREIELKIPARRDNKHGAFTASVRLLVRLCESQDDPLLSGQVAMFRSPGMVVRYLDQRALMRSSRPFHAMVLCGLARSDSEEDLAVEMFLRSAEPPGHDKWDVTETLKGDYERGYKMALEQMHTRIREALKSIVLESPSQGQRGPERLRRKFPIGDRGGGVGKSSEGSGSAKSAFRFSGFSAHFEDGRWHFRGEVRPSRVMASWACKLRLAEIGEDGSEVSAVAVEEMSVSESATFEIVEGRGLIRSSAALLKFEGASALGGSGRRALSLEINGYAEGGRGGK